MHQARERVMARSKVASYAGIGPNSGSTSRTTSSHEGMSAVVASSGAGTGQQPAKESQSGTSRGM
jgi:hypothetical protein